MPKKPKGNDGFPVISNTKSRHKYSLGDKYEAGIVLHGTEVKSIRLGNAQISESFAKIVKNELFEKYECDEKLFDTLDEALVYADSIEGEKREAEDQRREELSKKRIEVRERYARGEDADGDGDKKEEFIFVVIAVCALSGLILIFTFGDFYS